MADMADEEAPEKQGAFLRTSNSIQVYQDNATSCDQGPEIRLPGCEHGMCLYWWRQYVRAAAEDETYATAGGLACLDQDCVVSVDLNALQAALLSHTSDVDRDDVIRDILQIKEHVARIKDKAQDTAPTTSTSAREKLTATASTRGHTRDTREKLTATASTRGDTRRVCPICLDDIQDPRFFFRVRRGCKHAACLDCWRRYVRAAADDAARYATVKGLRCPAENCQNALQPARLDKLKRKIVRAEQREEVKEDVAERLDQDVARVQQHVARLNAGPDFRYSVVCPQCTVTFEAGATRVSATCPNPECRFLFCCRCLRKYHPGKTCDEVDVDFVNTISKPCPGCSTRIAHPHGHGCHHIRGCTNCRTHFCFVCLQTAEQNLLARRSRSKCRCLKGYWGTFCRSEDINANIQWTSAPFSLPYDRRCGCFLCQDCRPGRPCATCTGGDCVVCLDQVRLQVPTSNQVQQPQRVQQQQQQPRAQPQPRRAPCCVLQ